MAGGALVNAIHPMSERDGVTPRVSPLPGLDEPWTLGASDAKDLATGKLRDLWLMATGRLPRPDLSGVLAVQLGKELEPFHVRWFERRYRWPVSNQQLKVLHPSLPMHATLDGTLALGNCVLPWEGKTCGKDIKLHDLMRRYHAQLCQQSMCFDPEWEDDDRRAVLSILWLNTKHDAFIVHLNPDLCAELRERTALLGWHVEQDREPSDLPPYPVPMPIYEQLTADTREA